MLFAPNPSNPMESEMLPLYQVFRTVQLQIAVKNSRWALNAPARRPATDGRTAPMLFSG
jgi:hypothetical protein